LREHEYESRKSTPITGGEKRKAKDRMPGDELDRRQAHKPPGEEENTKSLSGFKREGSLVNEPTKRVKVTKVLVSLR
jgi:hypothetical protein